MFLLIHPLKGWGGIEKKTKRDKKKIKKEGREDSEIELKRERFKPKDEKKILKNNFKEYKHVIKLPNFFLDPVLLGVG